jgi:hypothetical protein
LEEEEEEEDEMVVFGFFQDWNQVYDMLHVFLEGRNEGILLPSSICQLHF